MTDPRHELSIPTDNTSNPTDNTCRQRYGHVWWAWSIGGPKLPITIYAHEIVLLVLQDPNRYEEIEKTDLKFYESRLEIFSLLQRSEILSSDCCQN